MLQGWQKISVPLEVGVVWETKTHFKVLPHPWLENLQINPDKNFQMRYYVAQMALKLPAVRVEVMKKIACQDEQV